MTFLWFIDFDFSTRFHHGATLRYLNYSRELIRLGHRVYFVVEFQSGETEAGAQFFRELKERSAITGFSSWLARDQRSAWEHSRKLASELSSDICIFSNRRSFFLVRYFAQILPSIIDFGDCSTLYYSREARFMLRNGNLRKLPNCVRRLADAYLNERRYGRLGHANIVVSQVDKAAFDRVTSTQSATYVLPNGVTPPTCCRDLKKEKNRLIFSGNMNFPPNYQAAIWFIDKVLPLICRAHPSAYLVLAGANPVPELLRRANGRVRVTGYVEDMNREIAASSLYVAPLITGGGFKNKIVEALANRTYVTATSMAIEFLDAHTAPHILVGDSAASLAARVIQFLSDPEQFDEKLSRLHSIVLSEFGWDKRAAQLLRIAENARRD